MPEESIAPTPEEKKVLEEVYNEHAEMKSLMIMLQQIQEKFGYIPEYSIPYLSEKMHISESHIYGVITFYAQFSTTPVGKNIIKVCCGTACHVGGSKVLGKKLRSYLKIEEGSENTEDMIFTVQAVACLGCCALAPAMMVNDKVYGKLDMDRIKEVVEEYRKASLEEDV
jgi:NADH-quinone oxidoreductase subunit E